MIELMAATIRQFNMIEAGDHVVAGISGGADSVCLLLNLVEYQKQVPYRLSVVHVNHMIREDAPHDAEFVRTLCEQYDIPFYLHVIDVQARAEREHLTTEEAGRLCRYEAYREHKPDKIAVGHHRSDVAETVLLNMCRGTGIHGMVGVSPVSGDVIRPLIRLTRSQIEAYLQELGQDYCTDSTNLTTDYTRNRLRLEVLPYLNSHINDRSDEHIASLAEDMYLLEDYIQAKSQEALDSCLVMSTDNTLEINLDKYNSLPLFLRKEVTLMLFNMLHVGRKDIGRTHVDSIIDIGLAAGEKRLDLPYGIRAVKNYDTLVMTNIREQDQVKINEIEIPSLEIHQEFHCTLPDGRELMARLLPIEDIDKIPQLVCKKWLDYDRIKCSVVIRSRRPGDYMLVDDAMHRQSIKDYLVNEKVPRSERDKLMMLADGDHIMWVLDHRISAYYKVSDTTRRVLEINIQA